MDVSPDGKKFAFTSRGELFVSDVEGKFIRQIHRGNSERASEVKWLPDNRTLIFSRTAGGYYNWYTIAADGPGQEKQITDDKQNNRDLSVNKAHTQGVYYSGREEVRLIDLKALTSKTIAKDEVWGFEDSQPHISPNGDYVVFNAHRNFEQDIFVYSISTGKTINLTNSGVSESDPVWSPDGKYIYFTALRVRRLTIAYGARDIHVWHQRMPLQKFDDAFRLDKFRDLFKEAKKDSTADKPKDKKTSDKKTDQPAPKPAEMAINTDDLMKRLERVSEGFGSQRSPYVIQKGDKTHVFYISNQAEGEVGPLSYHHSAF